MFIPVPLGKDEPATAGAAQSMAVVPYGPLLPPDHKNASLGNAYA